MVKTGQYKIQQMAFMILAIFFFFVLVGLFFIGWQYMNLKSNVSRLQEEKALSALKVIADSTELNCEQSEDWCIDRDKLTAFSELSHLYNDYWGIASIELLIVYPPRGQRVLSSGYEPPSSTSNNGGLGGCSSSTDHNGDGNPDYYVAGTSRNLHLFPNQGRLDHQSANNAGSASPPLTVYEDLVPGEKIKFSNVVGTITYGSGPNADVASCGKHSGDTGYGGVLGGFYTSDGQKIQEYGLGDFTSGEGVTVPKSASSLYVYVLVGNDFKYTYPENIGGCDFGVSKLVLEECEVVDSNDDNEGIDDFADSLGELSFESSGPEPILCPAPNCDYYILHTSGQTNKQTYSAYVTVCEDIDRSHQICELAKLMLGVKIADED